MNMIFLLADKPNHSLQYDIGTDFCIEDPVNSSLHLTINCPLSREPNPEPNFEWNIALNGRDNNTINLTRFVSSSDMENDTLTLNGMVNITQTSTLDITCEVSNRFGNDAEKTSISLCSKYMYTCTLPSTRF